MSLVRITRSPKPTAQQECDEWNRRNPPGTHVSVVLSKDVPPATEPLGPTAGKAFVREDVAVVFVGKTPWFLSNLVVTTPEAIDFEKSADERSIEAIPASIRTAIIPPPEPLAALGSMTPAEPLFDSNEARRVLAEYERTRDALKLAEQDFIVARESLGRFVDQVGATTNCQTLLVIGNRAVCVYPAGTCRAVEVADCVVVR